VFLLAAVGIDHTQHLPRFGPPIAVPAPMRRSLASKSVQRALRLAARKARIGFEPPCAGPGRIRAETHRRIRPSWVLKKRAAGAAASTGIDAATITAALVSDSAGGVNEDRAAITLLEACRRILIKSDSH